MSDPTPRAARPAADAAPSPDAGAGFWRADGTGVLWLGGDDRLAFLQRLTTNRLTDLAPGHGRSTVLLTDAGRVVDWLACHHGDDGTALVTSHPAAAPAVAAHLARYVLRDRVRITDASGQVVVVRLFGRGATDAAAMLLPGAADAPAGAFLRRGADEATTWGLRHTAPWPADGWDIVVPAGAARPDVADACRAAGLAPGDAAAEASLRIALGVPAFGAEIDGSANPLELGLTDLIDFAKGCYVGQEIVARLDSYDKVQRRLVRLHASAPMVPGDTLVPATASSVPAGRRHARARVTSASAFGGAWHALAVLPLAWLADRTVLVERTGEPAEIVTAQAIGTA